MYKSGMTARQVFDIVEHEADISVPIADSMCALWMNASIQMLYSEIVREERNTVLSFPSSRSVSYSYLSVGADEAAVEARDIVGVYGDGRELERISGGIGAILNTKRPSWYDAGSEMNLLLPFTPENIRIAHVVRPALITAEQAETQEVCVPPEFVPMLLSRLRGEIYKVYNEDALAAKWLADYNAELETFKVWAAQHGEVYGM